MHIIQKFLIIVCCLTTGIFSNVVSAQEKKPVEYYLENGFNLLEDRNMLEALKVYKEGAELYPEHPVLNEQLGYIYYGRENYVHGVSWLVKALNLYSKAVNIPEDIFHQIHLVLAISYYEVGREYSFSEELCLRILYHGQRYLEVENNPHEKLMMFELLVDAHQRYDFSENTKLLAKKDGSFLRLVDDGITVEQKRISKDIVFDWIDQAAMNKKVEDFRRETAQMKRSKRADEILSKYSEKGK